MATIGVELLDERLLVPNQSELERGGIREHKLENAPLHRRLSMHVERLQTGSDRLHAEHHVEFPNARDLKSARIDVASMETKVKPELMFSVAEIVAFEAPRPTDRAEAPNERLDSPFNRRRSAVFCKPRWRRHAARARLPLEWRLLNFDRANERKTMRERWATLAIALMRKQRALPFCGFVRAPI